MDYEHLKKKVGKGVKNINVSPLFEAGKCYNINSNSEYYQKEDPFGTLVPDITHCWLNWEACYFDEDSNKLHWTRQAEMFSSIEEAEKGALLLKDFEIKE